jgi:hypothetical protein
MDPPENPGIIKAAPIPHPRNKSGKKEDFALFPSSFSVGVMFSLIIGSP